MYTYARAIQRERTKEQPPAVSGPTRLRYIGFLGEMFAHYQNAKRSDDIAGLPPAGSRISSESSYITGQRNCRVGSQNSALTTAWVQRFRGPFERCAVFVGLRTAKRVAFGP
jgi:hypothetical protein